MNFEQDKTILFFWSTIMAGNHGQASMREMVRVVRNGQNGLPGNTMGRGITGR